MKDLLVDAIKLAMDAHQGQTRKDGITPYFLHPLRVMLKVVFLVSDFGIAAILHDVVEDSEYTESYLRIKFPSHVVDAIALLTRSEDQSYDEMIDAIIREAERNDAGMIAKYVKIADLRDNLESDELGREPTAHDRRRWEKYRAALARLEAESAYVIS